MILYVHDKGNALEDLSWMTEARAEADREAETVRAVARVGTFILIFELDCIRRRIG